MLFLHEVIEISIYFHGRLFLFLEYSFSPLNGSYFPRIRKMARRNKITLDKKVLSFSYQKSCISADYVFYSKVSFFSPNKDLDSAMSCWFKPGFMRDEKLRPKDHRTERQGCSSDWRKDCNKQTRLLAMKWELTIRRVSLQNFLVHWIRVRRKRTESRMIDKFLVCSTECTEMSCTVHWKTILSPPLREQGGRAVGR